MRKWFATGMLVACLISMVAFAADNPPAAANPPKYIWTQHVTIAGDKGASYPNLVAQYRRAAEAAKADTFWLAASNITGDLREVTFVSFYDNIAAVEKDLAGFEKIAAEAARTNPNLMAETGAAELSPRSTLAKYVPDLSYHPEKVPAAEAKWWEVTTIALRPGHMSDFSDLVKQELELLKKGNVDEHFLLYQVVAGLPSSGSTYYIVVPMKSLAEMDIDRSEQVKTVFTPIIRRHFESIVQTIVTHIETNLLMVRPELSRPPQTFLAANPDFWRVKEPAPAVAAKGKKRPKPAAAPAR